MILDDIARAAKIRVEKAKALVSPGQMREHALQCENGSDFRFEKALKKGGMAFICEVKKASPSKGVIAEDFPYLAIAQEYEAAGADAISVLTEPDFFQGSNDYLSQIRQTVKIPILRKDFTIDEYQIYEAKILGADAVLLICALLDTDTVKKYISVCDRLGLSALVEAHTRDEAESALRAGARVIGVNNRNLKTFEVDLNTCTGLRTLVPENILYVAESGIRTARDVALLRQENVNAVLIGETLMRSKDKKAELHRLSG
ncbi:MAG TPA: indole-3-glycerol phosphate synthase TrpC [Caproiciproducens sp.]|nr:indole-3-glycerol phosphate synthase TrpC [Caproiciproducens sp.]